MRLGDFGDAREEETFSSHLRREGERPHPELGAKHLLHVLVPEHVVVVGELLEAAISSAAILSADTGVLHLLVFHHLDRSEIVVKLKDDAESKRNQCD